MSESAIHLSTEFCSDLRFFAFFVGNGSLFTSNLCRRYGFTYIPFLLGKNAVFGQLFSVFVNVWQPCQLEDRASREPRSIPDYRAEQYLMNHIDSTAEVTPDFEPWELDPVGSTLPWKACVKEFSMLLGDEDLEPGVQAGMNYVPDRLISAAR